MKRNKQPDWVDFEEEVYRTVQEFIDTQRLMLDPKWAKVYRKRSYFSKDRNKSIIFDVAIEGFAPGGSEPSLVWPWECKDYPTRKVKVDEVEEFWAKLQQVGAHKGTVVTRVGFDDGAIQFAKSKRIGLVTLRKQLEIVTTYDASNEAYTQEVLRIVEAVAPTGIWRESNGVCANLPDYVYTEMKDSRFLK